MGTDIRQKFSELLTSATPLARRLADAHPKAWPVQIPASVQRLARRPVVPLPEVAGTPSRELEDLTWRRWLFGSFVACVLLPAFAAVLYFGFMASPQFVSEVQFAVRGNTERLPGTETLGVGSLGSLAALNSNQEAYAVADYIGSRSAVQDIQSSVDLHKVFGRHDIDVWARLEADASTEELLDMWRRMVKVSVETVSGIVSVTVKAFSAPEAEQIATLLRDNTEDMLNRKKDVMLRDQVLRGEQEVARARARLAEIQTAISTFRNSEAVVDPLERGRSVLETIAKLRGQLLSLEVQIQSLGQSAGPGAPQIEPLAVRRDALLGLIGALEGRLTGEKGDDTASRALVGYERLQIERTLAEEQVVLAERLLEFARSQLDRRHLYLDVIEGPTRPELALFPRRAAMIALVAFSALVIWSTLVLLAAGVRDHAA